MGQLLVDRCGGDPSRLRRIRLRFVRPVCPGDALVVEATSVAPKDQATEVVVRIRREGGEIVSEGDVTITPPVED